MSPFDEGSRYRALGGLALRRWPGEDLTVARQAGSGATHLLAAEAAAIIGVCGDSARGLTLREIAHAVGLGEENDPEVEAGLVGIIKGLLHSGLLGRAHGDAYPDPEPDA
ncbi:MAG: hypothetical protein JNL85_00125 [Rubrivivax sp.]|nr:hypothetical protein [Rubrivivax sp.]